MRYCYRAGSDATGREAVLLIGRQLPASVDLARVLLHVIRVLASFNGRPFTLIYIHGGVNDDVPFAFKRQVCNLFTFDDKIIYIYNFFICICSFMAYWIFLTHLN